MTDSISELTVRNPDESDEAQILELLSRAFRRWPQFELPVSTLEHLRWKMRGETVAARHHWVGEIDGRIVVMRLRIIRRFRVRGRDRVARDSVDAAVDPDYQERGLYSAMVGQSNQCPQYCEVDFGLSYSTNPRLQRREARKKDKSLANPIEVMEKPYRARAIVRRRRERYGGRLPTPLAMLRIGLETALHRIRHRPYRRPLRPGWRINTVPRFDARIDAFFDEAARPFDFLVVRSSNYMNWRYCEPAAGTFTIRVAEQDEAILGYLVFKISQGNGYIADLLALPGRLDVARSLLEDSLGLLREAPVDFVNCWMIRRHPYNDLLRRYGFLDTRRDVRFVYKAVNLDPRDLEFLEKADARIHLMHGDSDWI